MHLLLTSQQRLTEHYQRNARRVLAAITNLLAARQRNALESQLLLCEVGWPEHGIAGVAPEPAAISAQLHAVADMLEQHGAALDSVLIVGGPEIIPFHRMPNPLPADSDPAISTDSGYAGRAWQAGPEWAVGRLPGAAEASPRLLVRLLQNATQLHAQPIATEPRRTFGYSAAVWQRSSAHVYAAVGVAPLLISPPVVSATLDRSQLAGARLVYCNLHGVRDGPLWYGQNEHQASLFVALQPDDLRGLDMRGAVIVSEACYGATIEGRSPQTSLALAFLERGAAGFIGATALTYGPDEPPLGEADLVALHTLRALRQSGARLGAAFVAGIRGMLQETLARQPLDDDDRKTALSFVLYGDPTLAVGLGEQI